MCVSQIDLAFDHVPQAGTFPGQDHFDFEFSLSGQLLFTNHALDGCCAVTPTSFRYFRIVILNCSISNLLRRVDGRRKSFCAIRSLAPARR